MLNPGLVLSSQTWHTAKHIGRLLHSIRSLYTWKNHVVAATWCSILCHLRLCLRRGDVMQVSSSGHQACCAVRQPSSGQHHMVASRVPAPSLACKRISTESCGDYNILVLYKSITDLGLIMSIALPDINLFTALALPDTNLCLRHQTSLASLQSCCDSYSFRAQAAVT